MRGLVFKLAVLNVDPTWVKRASAVGRTIPHIYMDREKPRHQIPTIMRLPLATLAMDLVCLRLEASNSTIATFIHDHQEQECPEDLVQGLRLDCCDWLNDADESIIGEGSCCPRTWVHHSVVIGKYLRHVLADEHISPKFTPQLMLPHARHAGSPRDILHIRKLVGALKLPSRADLPETWLRNNICISALCRLIDGVKLVCRLLIGDKSDRKYGESHRFSCCHEEPWRATYRLTEWQL